MALLNSRALVWGLLALPGAWSLASYLTGAATYGEALHQTGDLSVQLLILTLAVSPLRRLFPRAGWTRWLGRHRRAFGVAVFAYALFHTLLYLVRKADLGLILSEGARPDLLAGWLGLVVFAALAATSNDLSVRLLMAAWKRLHLLVYAGAALSFAHWLLTAYDPKFALIHAGVLAAVLCLRIGLSFGRRGGLAQRRVT
jgi:sulfoxide reductase heme-binding subunit YedZ